MNGVKNVKILYVIAVTYSIVFVSIRIYGRKITHGLDLVFSHPEAVEVTVSVNRLNFIVFAYREASRRLLLRAQRLSLVAHFRLNGYPFYVVVGAHRMLNIPYHNVNLVTVNRENGYVLFDRCINSPRYKLAHFFAAAHHRHTRVLYDTDNISAVRTS